MKNVYLTIERSRDAHVMTNENSKKIFHFIQNIPNDDFN